MTENLNLVNSKKAKNDEFYTLFADVEDELQYYEKQLFGKTIFCNCNDGENSAFWQYFSRNFERLHLKKLIAVKYGNTAYSLEMTGTCQLSKKYLLGNGDFQSEESIALLNQADIVITNPPFSMFRKYMELLYSYNKKFLIIGNMNMIACQNIFPYMKNGMLRFGKNTVKCFMQENGENCHFGNVVWYTNLDCTYRHKPLAFKKLYIPENYLQYDNYPAIEVSRVADIPKDYYGLMGVPISYLARHDPERFDIIGLTQGNDDIVKRYENPVQHRLDGSIINGSKVNAAAVICVKEKPDKNYYTASNADGYLICKFVRVLIKRKKNI